jgi:hypothetical protein
VHQKFAVASGWTEPLIACYTAATAESLPNKAGTNTYSGLANVRGGPGLRKSFPFLFPFPFTFPQLTANVKLPRARWRWLVKEATPTDVTGLADDEPSPYPTIIALQPCSLTKGHLAFCSATTTHYLPALAPTRPVSTFQLPASHQHHPTCLSRKEPRRTCRSSTRR